MKAKKLKKLRKKVHYFYVLKSDGLFGDFVLYNSEEKPIEYFTIVLARDAYEAVKRYAKRKHCLDEFQFGPEECSKTFAKYKVLPVEKPFNRYTTYWY